MGCCEKKKPEKLLDNNTSISESESSAEFDYKNKKLTYKDFKPLKLIGRGSFGEVLLVRMIMNNKLYAMKVLDKKILKSKKQQIHTKTERDLMVKINCPFIVDIKSAFQDEYKLYIVSEFLQGGDLFFHLHEKKKFSEDKAKFYSMELVLALDCLHKNNMIYRDLKPENVLLDSDGHIKLTDFGLSKIFETEDDKAFTVCGTPQYLAPEVLLRKGYNKSVDWWSFGCLLYEMLTGKLPFNIKKAKNFISMEEAPTADKYEISIENPQKFREDNFKLAIDYYSKDNPFKKVIIGSTIGVVGSYSAAIVALGMSGAYISGGILFYDTAFLVGGYATLAGVAGLVVGIPAVLGGIGYAIYKAVKTKKVKDFMNKLSDKDDQSVEEEREIFSLLTKECLEYFNNYIQNSFIKKAKDLIEKDTEYIIREIHNYDSKGDDYVLKEQIIHIYEKEKFNLRNIL